MPAAVQHVEAIRGQVNYLMDCAVDLVHMPQTYEHTLSPFGTGHPRMSRQAALTLLS